MHNKYNLFPRQSLDRHEAEEDVYLVYQIVQLGLFYISIFYLIIYFFHRLTSIRTEQCIFE